MLLEMRVRNLGVIADLQLEFGPGMTAVTGETGAGKTLVVEAIELLVGGRAEPAMVRAGESEAVIEGRFLDGGGDEVVVRRVISAQGRSRAYIDGAMATAAELAARGEALVDLHGQHTHQSLLAATAQREALDAFAGVDLRPLLDARQLTARVRSRLDELGGDPRERAREIDLLSFQLDEIAGAQLTSSAEEPGLDAAEDRLANAAALREAGAAAYAHLNDEHGATDRIRAAANLVGHHATFASVAERMHGLVAELDDAAAELRVVAESVEEDPEELARVRARRQLLLELRRKYGETIEDVIAFGEAAAVRLAELRGRDDEVAALSAELEAALVDERTVATAIAEARRSAARPAGDAIESHLHGLALPRATLSIAVDGEPPCDDVSFMFCANPGETPLPLRKVASGGELARVMLALRLVLTSGPPTMVFDEVDAGIGGEAAVAVGEALAALGAQRQVLVVTHLPQVAAYADAQVQVVKQDAGERVVAVATSLAGDDRVVELSRMLAGDPDSAAARNHAKELLAAARKKRAG